MSEQSLLLLLAALLAGAGLGVYRGLHGVWCTGFGQLVYCQAGCQNKLICWPFIICSIYQQTH